MSPNKREGRQDTHMLVPLRVLYKLDTSAQYLLARQRRRVQVLPISEHECNERAPSSSKPPGGTAGAQRYAKVSLKTCLGAVCNASPELVCDRSRDYSVYVVDPLEPPPNDDNAVSTPQKVANGGSGNAPLPSCPLGEGVSIGMGLMSWCLAKTPTLASEDDEHTGYVIGKFVRDRGADALEIIMSLRETAIQTQRQHALSLSSWGLPVPSVAPSSEISSPSAPLSSPLPTSPSPIAVSTSSKQSAVRQSEGSLETRESLHSHSAATSKSPADTSVRTKTRKIGRPPGAKTHPEKRARQLAIQMHKEKLERLQNIVKMQNGEEYDKTLIIASECKSKVTEDIIARERKLLEELQSRPLIVDVPRYTSQPLPRRVTSPAAHIPLVRTTAPTRRKCRASTSGKAEASALGSIRNESISPVESTHGSTREECEANVLLSLLGSVLGKVDEYSMTDASTGGAVASQGNRKGKEKQTLPPVNNALADALLKLLPHLPNCATKPDEASRVHTDASLKSSANTPIDTASHLFVNDVQQARPEPRPSVSPKHAQTFKTAEESFYSESQRPSNGSWPKRHAPSRGSVPKVREDAHPVPGGGWARGKHLVPRVTASSTASPDGNPPGNDSNALTIVASDKENMPPAKSTRGLKRSLSSADAKENSNSEDNPSLKNGTKKRKQEDMASIAKSKTTKRSMLGNAETNKITLPASSPVQNKIPASPLHSMPVVAMSEPYPSLPVTVGPPLVASPMSPKTQTGTQWVLPRTDKISDELTFSNLAVSVPKTPPQGDRLLHDDVGESLFTPHVATSKYASPDAIFRNEDPSSPVSGKPLRSRKATNHTVELYERPSITNGESDYQSNATSEHRHVGPGWDLPPSSPPPLTSPILPSNDLAAKGNQMDWDFAMQLQSELDVEMEKSGTGGVFEDCGKTINCGSTSTSDIGAYITERSSDQPSAFEARLSDFDVSSDDVFDLGELEDLDGRRQLEGSEGIELDINELWNSLGPVIAQAQLDPGSYTDTALGLYDPVNDEGSVDLEEQGATVDPVKLAEDLKALFGGCVI